MRLVGSKLREATLLPVANPGLCLKYGIMFEMDQEPESKVRQYGRFKITCDTDTTGEETEGFFGATDSYVKDNGYNSSYKIAAAEYEAIEGAPENQGVVDENVMSMEQDLESSHHFYCWQCGSKGSIVVNGHEVCNMCQTAPSLVPPSSSSSSFSPNRSLSDSFGTHLMEVEDTSIPSHTHCVVLDCANIAHSYGIDRFNAKGIQLAIAYFEKTYCMSRLKIIGFIKAQAFKRRPRPGDGSSYRGNAMMETDDVDYLTALEKAKKISSVPPGEDDDVYILTESKRRGGFILTNDQFTDHQVRLLVGGRNGHDNNNNNNNNNRHNNVNNDEDNKLNDFKRHIEYFKCGYTWINDELRPYPASPMSLSLQDIEAIHCTCQRCLERM